MTTVAAVPVTARGLRRMLLPLALAQFICSFAGSNMNVMINDISHDLNTTVQGVQVCITLSAPSRPGSASSSWATRSSRESARPC